MIDLHTPAARHRGMTLNTTDLVDVVDAAQRLGTPVRFVRRLIAERRIRFYKVGRYVRLDPADLDAFIAAGQVDPSR